MFNDRLTLTTFVLTVYLIVIIHFTNAKIQLTNEDKVEILELHNNLRRQTARGMTKDSHGTNQPKAANMNKLKWNELLATESQVYAEKCSFAHSEENKMHGENLVWGEIMDNKTIDKMTILVGKWFEEINITPGYLACDVSNYTKDCANTGIGHYTQMMWAESYELGCGVTECDCHQMDANKFSGTSSELCHLLVCRYKSSGNIPSLGIYKEGEPCSQCEEGQTCDANDGLCTGHICKDHKEQRVCEFWKSKGFCNPISHYCAYVSENCEATCGCKNK